MSKNWILLRGLTRGNGHWGEFPQILENNGARVELMEIPGNGTWNDALTPTDPIEIIREIKLRSQFANKKERFNLCGISLGGMIALKWAESFPEDLDSVAIINSSLPQFSPFYKRLLLTNYPLITKAIFEDSPFEREKIILKLTSTNVEAQALYLQRFALFSQKYPIRIVNFMRQLLLANNIKIYKKVSIPIKVISGKQDTLVSPSASQRLAKELGFPLEIHPTAGHDLPLDAPDWLAKVILN